MNTFKRGNSVSTSLNIGNVKIYEDMWKKEMKEYYSEIDIWAKERGINYTYGILDKEKGKFIFYLIDSRTQNTSISYIISLEKLIDSFKDRELVNKAKKMKKENEPLNQENEPLNGRYFEWEGLIKAGLHK